MCGHQQLRTLCFIIYIGVLASHNIEIRDNDNNCSFATPKIIYDSHGAHVQLPGLKTHTINQHEKVLIGYFKTTGIFKYIGCINMRYFPAQISKHTIKSDPGQCYSLCRTKYIALHEKQCMCLQEKVVDTDNKSKQCDSKCSNTNSMVCGGTNINGTGYFASVYEYVGFLNETNNNDHCRAYKPQTNTSAWKYCGSDRRGLCRDSNGDVKLTSNISSWKDYTINCFDEKSLPADKSTLTEQGFEAKDDYIWINTIKSYYIENIHNNSVTDERGYIRLNNESTTFALSFEDIAYLNGSKFLCLKETKTKTNTNVRQQGRKNNRLNLIYVFVPLCLFGGIAVLIILSAIYIRSNCRRKMEIHPNTANQSTKGLHNRAYDCNFDPMPTFPVDPSCSYIPTNMSVTDLSNALTSETTQTTESGMAQCLIETNKDTLNTSISKQEYGDDIYCELDEDAISIYDHTDDVGVNKKNVFTENTYGTSSGRVIDELKGVLENVYDHASDTVMYKPSKFSVDDSTYNHALKRKDKNCTD